MNAKLQKQSHVPWSPLWPACLPAQTWSTGRNRRPWCESPAGSTWNNQTPEGQRAATWHFLKPWREAAFPSDLFQILTVSPEADRTARLSELKASVRTSVRWPPIVRRAVLLASDALTLKVSTVLFCSSSATFSSPPTHDRSSTHLEGAGPVSFSLSCCTSTSLASRRPPDLGRCLNVGQSDDLVLQHLLHHWLSRLLARLFLSSAPGGSKNTTSQIGKNTTSQGELIKWLIVKQTSKLSKTRLRWKIQNHFILGDTVGKKSKSK